MSVANRTTPHRVLLHAAPPRYHGVPGTPITVSCQGPGHAERPAGRGPEFSPEYRRSLFLTIRVPCTYLRRMRNVPNGAGPPKLRPCAPCPSSAEGYGKQVLASPAGTTHLPGGTFRFTAHVDHYTSEHCQLRVLAFLASSWAWRIFSKAYAATLLSISSSPFVASISAGIARSAGAPM